MEGADKGGDGDSGKGNGDGDGGKGKKVVRTCCNFCQPMVEMNYFHQVHLI